MSRWIRDAGKELIAFLAVTTLIGQSVLPVYADTADIKRETSGSGYTISDKAGYYALNYFDRIAVNAVKGALTLKAGDDFSISFPKGWEQIPYFAVQDDVLVVSGRKTSQKQTEQSGGGSVVVLGEDEPAAGAGERSTNAVPAVSETGGAQADPEEAEEDGAQADPEEAQEDGAQADPAQAQADGAQADPAQAQADGAQADPAETETDGAQADEMAPEILITIPSGIGLDTLRIAMEDGELTITDVTANAVTIQTGGSIVMKDVSLGTVDIYAEAGDVSMSECTFNSLNVGIADGSVDVSSNESLARCRIEVRTDDGVVSFNGTPKGNQYLQPGNGKRFLVIQSGSGDINING